MPVPARPKPDSMKTRTLPLPDAGATLALGARVAALLAPGEAVLLSGDLGSGKTTLARGLIAALTGETDVASPTYTLVQTYQAEPGWPLVHADLYRLETPDELIELGLDDAWTEGAAVIEWPDILGADRPADRLEISLSGPSTDDREAALTGHGRWEDRLDRLAD